MTGVEPSAHACEAARARGVDARAGTLATVALEPRAYDLIVFQHSLEHTLDPAGDLERVEAALAPGGLLAVTVPNFGSWQARRFRDRWFHLDLPRHRTHFTAAGARRLLQRQGFEVLRVEHLLLEHNPFGLWQSLVNRATPTPSWLFHALKRNAPLRAADAVPTALALPFAPVAAAVEAAAGVAGRGGTVAVLARRVA
jgi:SAM-dependent methyltransferase